MSDERTFGALLRAYRVAANFTQEDLAGRSGMSPHAISALERGTRRAPRPSTVEFLAGALGLEEVQRRRLIEAARGLTDSVESTTALRPHHSPDASTALAEADGFMASIPTDAVPPRGVLPTGSRMPLAP